MGAGPGITLPELTILKWSKMETNHKTAFEAIDRFLADNPELEELSARLSEFNVFRALKIEHFEIRHSNVLAWLLDPEKSHGLREMPLRRILSNILLLSDKTIPGLSAGKVEMMDFTDIEVLREWRNIDIRVVDRSNKIVLFFENKIHSGESKGQLLKYKGIVKNEFDGFKIVPVFLTLTGQESDDADSADYICYSHLQLLSVLEILYVQRKSQLAQPVQMFIQHYLDNLRRLTMQDQELMELCKKIYRKHQSAIDMIVEHGRASAFKQVMEDLLEKEGDFEILYSGPSWCWFLPKSWSKLIPENGIAAGWTHLKRPVSIGCWFEEYKGSISSHFEVSKMTDPDLRLIVVQALRVAGFKFTNKAFDRNATYSRFYGENAKIDGISDYENVYSVVENLLEKTKEEFSKAEAVFRNVFEKKDNP
jgi:hypothetical protein